jgi:hypothetical protein
MLLTMSNEQLDQLGLRPLGYAMRVREAVTDVARALLRLCEEKAVLQGTTASSASVCEIP